MYACDKVRRPVEIGYVSFEQEDCDENAVVACVWRHGTAEDTVTYLPDDGYIVADSATTTFMAPFSNQHHSNISKDFNPIHVSPYFSDFASLPGTTGMALSARSLSSGDINACTQRYTLSHPSGLLFATQFAQIARLHGEGHL